MQLKNLLAPAPQAASGSAGAVSGEPGLERWVAAGRRLRALGYPATTATRAFFVPGRLEIAGKHTDYAGGRSLVAATEQGLYLAVVARRDRELRLHDLASGESAVLDVAGKLAVDPGGWTAYPAAVARRMHGDLALEPRGAEIVFSSDLPAAAGLSSSSSLVVATWLALAGIKRPDEAVLADRPGAAREMLAEYLAAVEAGRPWAGPALRPFDSRSGHRAGGSRDGEAGVGTRGGSEDHVAILCSRTGCLTSYSYDPTRLERTIELAPGLVFAIAVSGVRAQKAGGARAAYNRASDLAADLAARWRAETGGAEPHLGAIRASGPTELDTLRRLAAGSGDSGELTRRLEHFVAESEEIVPAAAAALAAGDLPELGRLVDRSQRLAEKLLRNQVPETVHLARSARALGAVAASAFGAGFGGAVWALVERERLASFLGDWRADYVAAFPTRSAAARFFSSRPGPGAFELLDTLETRPR